MDRRSGNTFRKILRALADASDGYYVIYTSRIGTKNLRAHYFNQAARIVSSCLAESGGVIVQKMTITFPNSGCVNFGEVDLRGRDMNKITTVIDD